MSSFLPLLAPAPGTKAEHVLQIYQQGMRVLYCFLRDSCKITSFSSRCWIAQHSPDALAAKLRLKPHPQLFSLCIQACTNDPDCPWETVHFVLFLLLRCLSGEDTIYAACR
jgi:hypothetical protein